MAAGTTRAARILAVLFALGLAFAAFGATAPSTSANEADSKRVDIAAVDRFVAERMQRGGLPGMALAITRGDQVVYVRGYGEAAGGRPVTPRTQFRIASLSKSFTAVAVMQLVEASRVDLDTPVRNYLPGFAVADPRGKGITTRQLLNQTSGLADVGFPEARLPQPRTLEQRVDSLRDATLVSAPGAEYHYTNPNYQVLARLVEVVSGEPFHRYLRRHVFAPLDMGDTATVATAAQAPNAAPRLAQGHVLVFGMPVPRAEMDGFLGGSGGVISTARDMAHWLTMQNNGGRHGGVQVVSARSVRLMHTPPGGVGGDYAMGWFRTKPDHGPTQVTHNGILSTFYAEQVLQPDGRYGVAVLFNSHNGLALADYHGIASGVMALATGADPPSGSPGARAIGLGLGAATVLTVGLRARSLLRSPRWVARRRRGPARLVLASAGWVLPIALLALLPTLMLTFAGRAFTHLQLFLAMPSITIWLATAGLTGIVVAAVRLTLLARRRTHGPTEAG